MASSHSIRQLKDPFDFHVYVGFAAKDSDTEQRLLKPLETQLRLECCARKDIDSPSPNEELFEKYIGESEKCILFVTPEYLKDSSSMKEAAAAAGKAKRFSKDMLLVLTSPELPEESLQHLGLTEFSAIQWDPVTSSEDAILPERVRSWLLRNVVLNPIDQMPQEISGYAEAMVYYYGYLNWILGGHRQQMETAAEKLPDVKRPGTRVVLPMIIVVPNSCRSPKTFDVEGKILTLEYDFVLKPSDHGGCKKRDYKRSVMKLEDSEEGEVFYFSGEFPACLMTLYETYQSGLAGISKTQLGDMGADFINTLQSLLCHPDNRHCIDQYRLVLWPDETVDLHTCLLPVLRRTAGESDVSSLVVSDRQPVCGASFSPVDARGSVVGLWSSTETYSMRPDVSPRGICLVVSISDDSASADEDPDIRALRRLFAADQLDFDVQVHSGQMTSEALEKLLTAVAERDHNNFDAFVCYLSARGGRGRVCTSDGRSRSLVALMYIFNAQNCPTLRDKPKLFLVQTVDDGTPVDCTSHASAPTSPQTPPSVPSDGTLMSDASSLMPPNEDGECLVPRGNHVILSSACIPAATHRVRRRAGEVSVYVESLTDHLRRGVDVEEALRNAIQQFKSQTESAGGQEFVSVGDRSFILP